PYPEVHAKPVDFIHKVFQPALYFLFVDDPVAKRTVVVVALPEPAVVHDQHLDTQGRRLPGNSQQLFGIEVEIGGLPVIDQDRPLFVPVRAPDKVAAVEVMESPRHTTYALV